MVFGPELKTFTQLPSVAPRQTGEGEWHLERMQIQSYERLEEEDLSLVLERLRSLNVEWPDDALDRLRDEREASL